jgi:hypothetical protein
MLGLAKVAIVDAPRAIASVTNSMICDFAPGTYWDSCQSQEQKKNICRTFDSRVSDCDNLR